MGRQPGLPRRHTGPTVLAGREAREPLAIAPRSLSCAPPPRYSGNADCHIRASPNTPVSEQHRYAYARRHPGCAADALLEGGGGMSCIGRCVLSCSLPFALAALAPTVHADSITICPSKDNTLYQYVNAEESNGVGQYFFAGRTGQASGYLRRGLLAFDIAGAVPPGSTIESVSLRLHVSKVPNNTSRTKSLRRVLQDWGEGTSDAGTDEGGAGRQRPAMPHGATGSTTRQTRPPGPRQEGRSPQRQADPSLSRG